MKTKIKTKKRAIRKLRGVNDEEWKPIVVTDNMYEVSNYGRVKSFFYNKVDGRIIQPGVIRGFLVVNLKINEKTKTHYVHKLVAEEFVPKTKKDETVVIHLDWDKKNNQAQNLQWVNRDESYKRIHSRLLDERRTKGRIVTKSKLTSEDVTILKTMLKRGVRQNVIAKLFCISEMQVSRIKRNQNWSDVEAMDYDFGPRK
ncbi:MAG: hypothetical protein A2046_15450 [Bacteroidetes bacterium GWA2_30_7]|nr:MAG: hypothetical protein A2046_15450 [Bacteroidetes bacterium GWA2_30_7]